MGDACDPASCPPSPAVGCLSAGPKSKLKLRDGDLAKKKKLLWKWSNPDSAVTGDDLASGEGPDGYQLCLYEDGDLALSAEAAGDKMCGTPTKPKPCWTGSPAKGFRFKDKTAAPDGLTTLILKGSEKPGKAKIVVKGKGAELDMPSLSEIGSSVTVQLTNHASAKCFEATYAAPYKKQDAEKLDAETN